MADLLQEEFREFGRSGREYSRQEILQQLSGEATLPDIGVVDAACSLNSDEMVLLTYTPFHKRRLGDSEQGSRYTLRNSLWVKQAGRWRLRFHQGKPMAKSVN